MTTWIPSLISFLETRPGVVKAWTMDTKMEKSMAIEKGDLDSNG
jgi:hypothetical protein